MGTCVAPWREHKYTQFLTLPAMGDNWPILQSALRGGKTKYLDYFSL